jgi:hypothetical protein
MTPAQGPQTQAHQCLCAAPPTYPPTRPRFLTHPHAHAAGPDRAGHHPQRAGRQLTAMRRVWQLRLERRGCGHDGGAAEGGWVWWAGGVGGGWVTQVGGWGWSMNRWVGGSLHFCFLLLAAVLGALQATASAASLSSLPAHRNPQPPPPNPPPRRMPAFPLRLPPFAASLRPRLLCCSSARRAGQTWHRWGPTSLPPPFPP